MAPLNELLANLGREAGNHLWQSTAFAAVAGVVALSLKANHARVRCWLWLAASLKFLLPFSALSALCIRFGVWLAPAAPTPRVPPLMEQLVQPFTPIEPALRVVAAAPAHTAMFPLPAFVLAIWLCGCLGVLLHWWVRWRQVQAAVRSSVPLREGRELEALRRLSCRGASADLRVVSSTTRLEPGIFGILRPVLWLPTGVADRLSEAELEAILAHELCHACRRDNLAGAIHMATEAVFWFHPVVWWLGARLAEERERACDEEVVRMVGEPQIYAESILKVCEFYLASPVTCAAGVTGGTLKKRIEYIMTNRTARELSLGKRVILAAVAVAAILVPITVGWSRVAQAVTTQVTANPATRRAQSSSAAVDSSPEPPQFEVASVKRAAQCFSGRNSIDPGSVAFRGVPLKGVLMEAFKVKMDQIEGPSWLETGCFDIAAKIPDGASRDQLPAMLQALLAERFKLAAHKEDRPRSGYALVVDKGGPKFKEDDPKANFMRSPNGRQLTFFGAFGHGGLKGVMTMATVAANLSREGYGPVEDATGLTGRYDIDVTWVRDAAPRDPAASVSAAPGAEIPVAEGPSLFAALRESLGLRLERRNVQVQFLVIDHIERIPTEN